MTLRPWLLGGVAVLLAAMVAREYWPAPPEPQPVAPVVKAARPTLNPMARRGPADFAALSDHPLFDPTRAKVAAAVPVAEAAPAPAAEPAPVAEATGPAHPVLMGTVTSPWPGGAYLGDDAGGPVVFLRPGQEAQGLHLEEVQAGRAIFKGPEGEVTLTLQKVETTTPAAPSGDVPAAPAAMPAP